MDMDSIFKILDTLPEAAREEIIKTATRLLAQNYAEHILGAPVPDAMKINALCIAIAALAKCAQFEDDKLKTAGDETVNTPEELIDHMCIAAKKMLSGVMAIDLDKMKVNGKTFIMPATTGKPN